MNRIFNEIFFLVEVMLENRQNAQNAAALAQNNEINQVLFYSIILIFKFLGIEFG
jgi:hypothetical protein